MLATDFLAPRLGLEWTVGAGPLTVRGAAMQVVDRTHKGDRLIVPASVGQQQAPKPPRPVMIGCEPLYGPLVATAPAANMARCIAEIGHVTVAA